MGLLPVPRIVVICRVFKDALAAVVLMAMGTPLSCGHDLVSVNERIFVKKGASLQYNGGGCMTVQLGGSGSLAPRPLVGSDFEVTEGEDANDVVVQVFSDNALLVSRRYNEATLWSGAVDEFTVTTHAGGSYLLRYWGGSCASLDADIDPDSGE
jgi:hypothetical protein